jgi:hypothetical protein
MIRAENLIVEGKCFVPFKTDSNGINALKRLIAEFMDSRLYHPNEGGNVLFPSRFLSLSFSMELGQRGAHLSDKIKKNVGLISKFDADFRAFARALSSTRDELPYTVTFRIASHETENHEGLAITIRSEPVLLFKMRNLNMRPKIDEFDYSDIISHSKKFINDAMLGIGAVILEKPSAIAEFTTTPTLEKLEKFGLVNVVNLLKQGRTKVQRGDTEDGLTDLRESIALFVRELVEKTGERPTDKVSQNLASLKELGYMDKWSHEVIHSFLYEWLYAYLSAKPVHRRERICFDDAEFLYVVTEDIMSYLCEKVFLGR